MSVITNEFLKQKGDGDVDLVNDVIEAVLLDSTYTPNKDHTNYTDVSPDEVSGTGYTAGGKPLAGKAWVKVDASDYVWFDSNDLQWTGATLTDVTYVALIDQTAGDLLIGVWDITGAPLAPVAGDLDITVDANGWLRSAQA